jgi:hypothetical protein
LNWETVATYPFRPVAEFMWSVLDGMGIPVRILSDDGAGTLPHIAYSTGVRVQVPTDRADAAREALDAAEAELDRRTHD